MAEETQQAPVEDRRLEKAPPVGPIDAFEAAFARYASFKGRARRSEFWWFFLEWAVVTIALLGVGAIDEMTQRVALVEGTLLLLYLAMLPPYLAVFARRLHDTGRSGWWLLLGPVPLGSLVLVVWACQDSDGDNQWGPYSKWKTWP